MAQRRTRQRGAALIMTLAVIGVLILLVTAFAMLTRLERKASLNYVDGERARFAAWSGIERAKHELRRAVTTRDFPATWVDYEPAATVDVPLEGARHPSFRMAFASTPRILEDTAGGRTPPPWPSGVVGSTYYQDPDEATFLGDYYVLKVTDNNSRIFLNESNADNLRLMLNTLGAVVDPPVANLGSRVLELRPTEGFQQLTDLLAPDGLTRNELDAVGPYLTCHAWIDRTVVRLGAPAIAQPALERSPRAPININMAPWPVLVAAFNGISWSWNGSLRTVDLNLARQLADAVIFRRTQPQPGAGPPNVYSEWGRFETFGELYRFLGGEQSLPPDMAAGIFANANPNTDLNKLVPDLSYWRPIDKTDLLVGTTEFCLASGGIFTIESLGVVLGASPDLTSEGRPSFLPVASAKVRSVVRIFERYTESTQRDFETGRVDPPSAPFHRRYYDPSSGSPIYDEVTAYRNLKDMTTLPEYQNRGTAANGMHLADYDGQVVFNAITLQEVSLEGYFFGHLLGDLRGWGPTLTPGPGVPLAPLPDEELTARGMSPSTDPEVPSSVAYDVDGRADFARASDLHPLGARLGDRALRFTQDAVATVLHETPCIDVVQVPAEETAPILAEDVTEITTESSSLLYLASVNPTTYEAIDAFGVEAWFKPDFILEGEELEGERQYLVSWESGDPEPTNATLYLADDQYLEQYRELVVDVYVSETTRAQNISNYLATAGAWNGTDPETLPEPPVEAPPGYDQLPPPSSEALQAFLAGKGPYEGDPEQLQADAEAFADFVVTHYGDEYLEWIQGVKELLDEPPSGNTWGAKARLEIWLEALPLGGDHPQQRRFRLHGEFEITDKGPTMSKGYLREWHADFDIRAGTWHHLLFSFYAIPTVVPVPRLLGLERTPPQHTNMYLDGHLVPGQGEEGGDPSCDCVYHQDGPPEDRHPSTVGWPTETDPHILDVLSYIENTVIPSGVIPGATEIELDEGNYAINVQLVPGEDPFHVGEDLAGQRRFHGLLDNLVFQGNFPKALRTFPEDRWAPRFDVWRPSLGRKPNLSQAVADGGDDPHVFFTKRTPAIEWEVPIRVGAYAWTAWKHIEFAGDAFTSYDLGPI